MSRYRNQTEVTIRLVINHNVTDDQVFDDVNRALDVGTLQDALNERWCGLAKVKRAVARRGGI